MLISTTYSRIIEVGEVLNNCRIFFYIIYRYFKCLRAFDTFVIIFMYVLKKQEMFYNRILILRKTKKHLETNKNLKLFPSIFTVERGAWQ